MIVFFQNNYSSCLRSRIASYDFIENFIDGNYKDRSIPPDTNECVELLKLELDNFSNEEISFLLCHLGYIPENYLPDSSLETLFTKLVETVVLEWAVRIGFEQSFLPTQKSSKEDVTIRDSDNVIVCDAKSFRLGRSQAAPNVKDVLKHADISKWLSAYPNFNKLGGLVTLPSQHDWKRGSDFYQYTTDKHLPTLCFNYEHMAFILLLNISKNKILDVYSNYGVIFPKVLNKTENNRDIYYEKMEGHLFSECLEEWRAFNKTAKKIISERVFHSVSTLECYVEKIKMDIECKYKRETDIERLRQIAIDAEYRHETEDLHKQIDRIHSFRSVSDGYF